VKNKIEDLRNHLFETLESLKDKEAPMELERAETIAKVAQVIVNSAKVEVDFLKHTGAAAGHAGTEFIPANRRLENKPSKS
jgi:hypothetical protein